MKPGYRAIALMSAMLVLVLLPVKATPAEEGRFVLNSLVDMYGPVAFDHETHKLMAGDCGACHHGHDQIKSSCTGCHALDASEFKGSLVSTFPACGVCHGTPDRESPDMPGLKVAYHVVCFECHRDIGQLGRSPAGCTEMCHQYASR